MVGCSGSRSLVGASVGCQRRGRSRRLACASTNAQGSLVHHIFCMPMRLISEMFDDDSAPRDGVVSSDGVGPTTECLNVAGVIRRSVVASVGRVSSSFALLLDGILRRRGAAWFAKSEASRVVCVCALDASMTPDIASSRRCARLRSQSGTSKSSLRRSNRRRHRCDNLQS